MGAWRYEIDLLVFNLDISLVRFAALTLKYRVEHSKINFISPRARVLFSIYLISIISTGEFNSDWSRSSHYDAIFTALGGKYSISRLGY